MELFDLNIHFPVTDPTWIFFLVLIIILFAPMILGRLRIPHIIGMILAGVVVGKYGFNILERDSSFELFGKVGLYYIMFLAGLEMDMDDFKKNRTKGLIFGMFTFLIPMGLGIWSSMSMLDYGFLTSVLLASMYASHTLIAYPIISRYGLSRQRTVSITIGGTAVTVVLALMVLAVIGGMYKGEDVGGLFWVLLVAKVVLLFGLIIFLMPRISRWFFRTYEDAVMQFIFVLAMVFLGGGLMELVGRAKLGFQRVIARQALQHHSFSKRSTFVTMTVAPPTVTSIGIVLSMPRPSVAVPGTISVRCLQHLEMMPMQSSTRSSSVQISSVMLPAIRKPPVVARRVT